MPRFPRLFPALFAPVAVLLADITPHPTRPDRLVDTRGDLAVEYSAGQEAWAEMAFDHLQTWWAEREANAEAFAAPTAGPELPGSAADLRARREAYLAAIAAQIGLDAPTDLQARTFDTFLGYYEMMAELSREAGARVPGLLEPRRMAIWQIDDLKQRLRAGAEISGMSYDPATDQGSYEISGSMNFPDLSARMTELKDAIRSQQVKHTFTQNRDGVSASFSLRPPDRYTTDDSPPDPASEESDDAPAPFTGLVIPVIYHGAFSSAPDPAAYDSLSALNPESFAAMRSKFSAFRDPRTVFVILHETAEAGLVDAIIRSKDRRWLCDGTANYVAWRVARDLLGPEFAHHVYNLDAQLRLHAAHQPRIDLTRWAATENQPEDEQESDLNKAHYAFATRVIFMLAARHGEDALAQLWRDVAAVGVKKASAKTFATALRQRYDDNLKKLIRAAETSPLPPMTQAP